MAHAEHVPAVRGSDTSPESVAGPFRAFGGKPLWIVGHAGEVRRFDSQEHAHRWSAQVLRKARRRKRMAIKRRRGWV